MWAKHPVNTEKICKNNQINSGVDLSALELTKNALCGRMSSSVT